MLMRKRDPDGAPRARTSMRHASLRKRRQKTQKPKQPNQDDLDEHEANHE